MHQRVAQELYPFFFLKTAKVKRTSISKEHLAFVTMPTAWQSTTSDTRSFLTIKSAGLALKGNQLWFKEIMSTAWPLKLQMNAFSLSWIIPSIFYPVRELTVHSMSSPCIPCHACFYIQSNKKRCSLPLRKSPHSLIRCGSYVGEKWDFFSHSKGNEKKKDDKYVIRSMPFLLKILCDMQRVKLSGLLVIIGYFWVGIIYFREHTHNGTAP